MLGMRYAIGESTRRRSEPTRSQKVENNFSNPMVEMTREELELT